MLEASRWVACACRRSWKRMRGSFLTASTRTHSWVMLRGCNGLPSACVATNVSPSGRLPTFSNSSACLRRHSRKHRTDCQGNSLAAAKMAARTMVTEGQLNGLSTGAGAEAHHQSHGRGGVSVEIPPAHDGNGGLVCPDAANHRRISRALPSDDERPRRCKFGAGARMQYQG